VNARVSLPSSVVSAPLLETLVHEPVDDILKRFADTMLRPTSEVAQLMALGHPNTYMDAVLKNNPKNTHNLSNDVQQSEFSISQSIVNRSLEYFL
jgi:hypothetical protein